MPYFQFKLKIHILMVKEVLLHHQVGLHHLVEELLVEVQELEMVFLVVMMILT